MDNEDISWVLDEFAGADFGDARRTDRLIKLASALAKQPTASFPEALKTQAELTATYRFFDNAQIDPNEILSSHTSTTINRLRQEPLVLSVQDTTEFDFTGRKGLTGAGPLSNKNCQGFFAHTTLAITPERVPLGILAQLVWSRDPEQTDKRSTRRDRPIEEKESHKWLLSLQATIDIHASCEKTRFISIGDREADIYDLFLVARPKNVDLLIRAAQNRNVETADGWGVESLLEQVAAQEVATTIQIQVPRRQQQPARQATLTLRYCKVTLCAPQYRASEHLPPVDIWVVWAVEDHPQKDVEPITWLLLTTCVIDTVNAALMCLDWYTCRWGIEILHKVLKSGCQIEARQLESSDRIKRCLSVYSVIAWRILFATMLSRSIPNAPCTALLDPNEWQALYCAIHEVPTPPEKPPTLHQAVRWIGRLGGFLDRKNNQPGVTVLWKGFQHLTDLTKMYRILKPKSSSSPNVIKP